MVSGHLHAIYIYFFLFKQLLLSTLVAGNKLDADIWRRPMIFL